MSRRLKKWRKNIKKEKLSIPQKEESVCFESKYQEPSYEQPASVAIIYRSELEYIYRCILDYPNIETGGQLFGFWTAEGIPVVAYAIGPGRNANHQVSFFQQDIPYLKDVGKILIGKYGLQHMGEWHSHHQLSLARPSGHDANTISSCLQEKDIKQFLLCIGNCYNLEATLNAFNFTKGTGTNFTQATWEIKNIDSPYRMVVDEDLRNILCHPIQNREFAMHGELNRHNASLKTPIYENLYWLKEKQNNLVLKSIVDFLKTIYPNCPCKVQLNGDNHVVIQIENGHIIEKILFPNGFPNESPIITVGDSVVRTNYWYFNGDIYTSFIEFYKKLIRL